MKQKSRSHRHHYLPEYFIKGFTDQDNKIWVYDKVTDRIHSSPKSPKSIFFENNRNTTGINGLEPDIVEIAYSKIDNLIAPYVLQCRNNPFVDEIENIEVFGYLFVFIITQYWRIPSMDDELNPELKSLLNLNGHVGGNSSSMDHLSSDDQAKVLRLLVPLDLLLGAKNQNLTGEKFYYKVIDFKQPVFLLSDNPVLFRMKPQGYPDFLSALIFPISSSRAFTVVSGAKYDLDFESIKLINLLLMRQSKRYVGCFSKTFLEKFIKANESLKFIPEIEIEDVKEKLFVALSKSI
jgi:hypothetical protein